MLSNITHFIGGRRKSSACFEEEVLIKKHDTLVAREIHTAKFNTKNSQSDEGRMYFQHFLLRLMQCKDIYLTHARKSGDPKVGDRSKTKESTASTFSS